MSPERRRERQHQVAGTARWALVVVASVAALLTAAVVWTRVMPPPIVIGAIYPTAGSQGSGGLEEFRGVSLAADYVTRAGGVHGRPIRLRWLPVESRDAAPGAVARLAREGISLVIGSYGSTISRPAADAAADLDVLFWETGAVGELSMRAARSDRVFRFAPTGASLGRAAVVFVREQLLPRIGSHRAPRYAIAFVDDVYGRAVGHGALAELQDRGIRPAAVIAYDLRNADFDALAATIAGARADILIVAAYLEDGIALRRAVLRARVPLIASIGTSSSYCMPAFGEILGRAAVGVFASDKPDGDVLRADALLPAAARALQWGREEYRRRFGEAMSAPGLSGFAGGLALFQEIVPAARETSAQAVAETARTIRRSRGSLPNGSGIAFESGGPEAGANLLATSVIWQWVRPNVRAVVWPRAFATHAIVPP